MSLLTLMLLAQVQINLPPPPPIMFPAPPPLVVVQPGVQVVEDNDDEIFFVDGFYWVRRDGHWFKSKDHKGNWVFVEEKIVPVTIVKSPPGHYKRWKGKKGEGGEVKVKEKDKGGHGHGKGKK
jgi:hypothetical protein